MSHFGNEPGSSSGNAANFAASRFAVLLFDERNLVFARRDADGRLAPSLVSESPLMLATGPAAFIRAKCGGDLPFENVFSVTGEGEDDVAIFFARTTDASSDALLGEGAWLSIGEMREIIAAKPDDVGNLLRLIIAAIGPHLGRLMRIVRGESDYIYRFRAEKQRNRSIYDLDGRSRALYQSRICAAIKAVKRVNERSSSAPVILDFGAVRYLLPSHFGFCLGVRNAIERAYETLAESAGRRVFMLSELIHNPFVNDDLRARGLRYLQTDKGEPLADPESGRLYWDFLTKDDIVVIPAFGATDEDKRRLIEKGVAIDRYDATCMLVEKVWKAARRFARAGHTVIIHGKAEHEETKATFSNAARRGPTLIVRDCAEAQILGEIVRCDDPARRRDLFARFAGRHTPGFDPARDLERIAVVSQTTLLRNETMRVISRIEEAYAARYGADNVGEHVYEGSGDTLCYATQVNQDALEQALDYDLDIAIVVGGINSSNTFQLFRICDERLGDRAFYIQSEQDILSRDRIRHYCFPRSQEPCERSAAGGFDERPFLQAENEGPTTILLTGGASCPDGIIQRIIDRINSFFPASSLRPIDAILEELKF